MDTYLTWIAKAWDDLDRDLIKKSFKVCGITINTDGSENDLVHYFKTYCEEEMTKEEIEKAWKGSPARQTAEEELVSSDDYKITMEGPQ